MNGAGHITMRAAAGIFFLLALLGPGRHLPAYGKPVTSSVRTNCTFKGGPSDGQNLRLDIDMAKQSVALYFPKTLGLISGAGAGAGPDVMLIDGASADSAALAAALTGTPIPHPPVNQEPAAPVAAKTPAPPDFFGDLYHRYSGQPPGFAKPQTTEYVRQVGRKIFFGYITRLPGFPANMLERPVNPHNELDILQTGNPAQLVAFIEMVYVLDLSSDSLTYHFDGASQTASCQLNNLSRTP